MEEMELLRKMLDERNIPWTDASDGRITRTHFKNRYGVRCSVVFSKGLSYGSDQGLLEVMPPLTVKGDSDDVEGWVSAEDIISLWA